MRSAADDLHEPSGAIRRRRSEPGGPRPRARAGPPAATASGARPGLRPGEARNNSRCHCKAEEAGGPPLGGSAVPPRPTHPPTQTFSPELHGRPALPSAHGWGRPPRRSVTVPPPQTSHGAGLRVSPGGVATGASAPPPRPRSRRGSDRATCRPARPGAEEERPGGALSAMNRAADVGAAKALTYRERRPCVGLISNNPIERPSAELISNDRQDLVGNQSCLSLGLCPCMIGSCGTQWKVLN